MRYRVSSTHTMTANDAESRRFDSVREAWEFARDDYADSDAGESERSKRVNVSILDLAAHGTEGSVRLTTGEVVSVHRATDDDELDEMLTHYVATALWSSTDDDGEPMDGTYTADDLAPETMLALRNDLAGFVDGIESDGIEWRDEWSPDQLAHDLWLTQNHHGAGFWDRGKALGDKLTEWAHSFGTVDLYVGDDGKVYAA